MTLDESKFASLADDVLRRLVESIDAAADDAFEADLRNGVLTIDIESGGQYIVNKHAPNREIWVSSPRSGAWHFAYDEARKAWVDTRARGGEPTTLLGLLESELTALARSPVRLGSVA